MQVNEEYSTIKVKKISPDAVIPLLKEKNPFILDVRPYFMKNRPAIKGSVKIPLMDLANKLSEIPRNRAIILTDWAMKQSIAAAKFLLNNGYQVIGVVKGGTLRWQLENKPLISPSENK